MDKIRNWLWKSLGITLDRGTKIVGGIVIVCTLLTILFASLAVIIHAGPFLLLAILSFAVVFLILFGGSYRAFFWGVASQEERKKMEEEVAQKQLRRRARDPHFQP